MRWLYLVLAVISTSGCLGETPEDREIADLGSYDDGDEEHRPGQPCLLCHGFEVAGTVFRNFDDDDESGLEGAEVIMTDDIGREFTALTNAAGNFIVEIDSGLSAPRQRNRGLLEIPFAPAFPLSVTVRFGDQEQVMESLIWRDGSCAGCHRGSEPRADGVEKIWVEGEPQ